mgnify:CR=1 FL=1
MEKIKSVEATVLHQYAEMSDLKVVHLRDMPTDKMEKFFAAQPEDAYTFFKPHDFDVKSLKKLQRNRSFLAYYAASDCFVFPSYREGFPNTVMETGAMDLPCIVTDINGSREIIVHGKNGVVIPPKDSDALYHAMKEMLEEKNRTKEYAVCARDMIASRFDQHFVRKCLYDFYDEIM